ncbi:MAG: hypothetical protein MJ120_00245 [Clostridia bacterium]|nr:hypothetical protein [Clostridia bacterium]
MTIYKVYSDFNIEAKELKDAESILDGQNGNEGFFTTSEEEAKRLFNEAKAKMVEPHFLGYLPNHKPYYWFCGALVEMATDCEVDEDVEYSSKQEKLKDAFLSGCWGDYTEFFVQDFEEGE